MHFQFTSASILRPFVRSPVASSIKLSAPSDYYNTLQSHILWRCAHDEHFSRLLPERTTQITTEHVRLSILLPSILCLHVLPFANVLIRFGTYLCIAGRISTASKQLRNEGPIYHRQRRRDSGVVERRNLHNKKYTDKHGNLLSPGTMAKNLLMMIAQFYNTSSCFTRHTDVRPTTSGGE